MVYPEYARGSTFYAYLWMCWWILIVHLIHGLTYSTLPIVFYVFAYIYVLAYNTSRDQLIVGFSLAAFYSLLIINFF
jgi:hypothetical protein